VIDPFFFFFVSSTPTSLTHVLVLALLVDVDIVVLLFLLSFLLFFFVEWLPRPYPKRYLASAQVLSIVASLPSGIHPLTLAFCVMATIGFQSLWVSRWTFNSLLCLCGYSALTAVAMVSIGLVVPYDWNEVKANSCYNNPDKKIFGLCRDTFETMTCSISGLVWIYNAYCVFRFISSGDFRACEDAIQERERQRSRDEYNRRRERQQQRQQQLQEQRQRELRARAEFNRRREQRQQQRREEEQRNGGETSPEVLEVEQEEQRNGCETSPEVLEVGQDVP
jgi:hypothetical protein